MRALLAGLIALFAGLMLVLTASPSAAQTATCATANIATGGTVTQLTQGSQIFCVHRFNTVGNNTFTLNQARNVEYLIVGGGGGGGSSDLYNFTNWMSGGGGGAGGVLQGEVQGLGQGQVTVVVGAGGAGGTGSTGRGDNGADSSFGTLIGRGGGGGGGSTSIPVSMTPTTGGSGGGGGGRQSWDNQPATSGAAGTSGQGNAGGDGRNGNNSAEQTGAGGGGAGGAGGNGLRNRGGVGGAGITSSISGTAQSYAGGGGGGHRGTSGRGGSATHGGGNGAGGNSTAAAGNGAANTGGGGGGAGRGQAAAGNGGSGVVILRYLLNPPVAANAGEDAFAFAGLTFALDGSASTGFGGTTSSGSIATYLWEQINIPAGGTTVTLTGANTAQASFTPSQPIGGTSEVLTFRLTVTDGFGVQTTDDVTITLQGMANLVANKTARVFSQDGSGCDDFAATPPPEPVLPAPIPGACVEYTISVENSGPVAATAIELTDNLPAEVSFIAAETAGWTARMLTITGNSVAVTDGVIAAGATGAAAATITIRALVK